MPKRQLRHLTDRDCDLVSYVLNAAVSARMAAMPS
jgi:hypothetical protein